MWEKSIGIFPVAWPKQTDEWLFHLGYALNTSRLPGRGASPAKPEVIVDPPLDGTMQSSLRVVPDPAGSACIVFGEESACVDDDARRWQEAAAASAAKIGKHDQDFAWRAIAGAHPNAGDWVRVGPLAEQTAIGPVLLTPGGVQTRELIGYSRGQIERLWPERRTWPIVISGSVRTYNWEPASYVAHRMAHRVCAILSLYSGTRWIVRSGPDVPMDPASARWGPKIVPQSVGIAGVEHVLPDDSLPADFNTYSGEHPLTLAAWLAEAWKLMDTDDDLETAIHACYEALGLEVEHPSMAFLLYVAIVEGISSRGVKRTQCKQCGHDTEAGVRFRAALGRVMEPDEVSDLAGRAYGLRSRTGHSGILHSTEDTFGYGGLSMFEWADRDLFDDQWLSPLRKACRELIREIIREAGPET